MQNIKVVININFPQKVSSIDGKDTSQQVGGVFEMSEEELVALMQGDARAINPLIEELKTKLETNGRKLYLK